MQEDQRVFVRFWFRTATGQLEKIGPYEFESEELTNLANDFVESSGGSGTNAVRAYSCREAPSQGRRGEDKMIALNFKDLVFFG